MQAPAAGGDGAAGPQLGAGRPAEPLKQVGFLEEMAGPCRQVLRAAWAARGKLVQDVRSYVVVVGCAVCSMPSRAARVASNPKLHALVAEEEDPVALAAVVFGAGGALCLGSICGVLGAALGGACGAALGAVPALFTFGLSLPVGAALGVLLGAAGGAAVGGGAGCAAGAASGALVGHFRSGIRRRVLYAASVLHDAHDLLVARPVDAVRRAARRLRSAAASAVDATKAQAAKGAQIAHGVASDRRAQATVAGAGAGAVALGTAGAAGGALIGGTVGALVGLVPAVFTFGLSIPLGAVVGGGAGLVAGGAAGAAAGLACGGGASFLGYTYWEAPGSALARVKGRCRAAAAKAGPAGAAAARDVAEVPVERAKAD